MAFYHEPVMLQAAVSALAIRPGGIYVDATLGGGGHTRGILEAEQDIRVYAFDQDGEAIDHARQFLTADYPNLTLIHDNFSNLWTRLALERIKKIDGILFDLGVSSRQLDSPERGFSFMAEGELDLRMNRESATTAADIVNKFTQEELKKIFFEYGEEREAARIAAAIVEKRRHQPIRTTSQLAEIIESSTLSHQKIKAKARIFQALRIYLNRELEILRQVLDDAVRLLNPGGRLAVISYHSLEDRLVKQLLRYLDKDCICPPSFPECVCGKKSTIRIITRKPLVPTAGEIQANPRARSAKLRIAEKKEV